MSSNVKSWIMFVCSILIVWQIVAFVVHNPFIMPYPSDVFVEMFALLLELSFYKAIGTTFLRVFISISISFVFAFLLSYISLYNRFACLWIEKLMVVIRTIPNVVLIVLFLFWFSRETVTFLVSFFLLCPIIYENIYRTLNNIENQWRDVLSVYKQPLFTKVKYVHLPLLNIPILSSLVVACSMGVKVGIMAEILGQVTTGIGRQIQIAKLDVNLTVVLAWTMWIILFVLLINGLLNKLEKRSV